jgi:hypothetical protein
MTPQTLHLLPGDETALQYLGAAVVLQWHRIPEEVQKALIQQAESVGGLAPVTSLHQQIQKLIERVRG